MRPDIARMESYTPVKPFEVLSRELGRQADEIIKLDANENPYGPSPKVTEALSRFPWYHVYPDPQQSELRQALAGYVGVPAKNILPGHGADELLDYLCRLFLTPGDAIINCPPTFGMYRFDALLSGGKVIDVWRDQHFGLDIDGIERAAREAPTPPKILFLTSPNNPDGGLIPHDVLQRLLRLPLLVVVDEAYIEFADEQRSAATWVLETDNLVVLRTFSKWAGLAGLRLGYGVFPEAIMQHLWKFKQPYNVNVAATAAGLASLADLPRLRQRVEAMKGERQRLVAALGQIPYLSPIPSQANFVLCRVQTEGTAGPHSAVELYRQLAERGVLVRYYDKPGLRNFIRVSVGKPEHTEILLRHLSSLAAS